MANLVFFDEGHRYQLDGEDLPSVSEIIRFISREVYGTVTQFKLDSAADRGTRAHKACEILDKYGTAEVDEEILPYIKAYKKFLKEHSVKWDKIEFATHHSELKYAGTIDRRGEVDGKKTKLDIKTSSTIHKPLVGAQLNLYELMDDVNSDQLLCLHLKPDATYKLIDIEINYNVAMACLTLHKALQKKPKKKKENDNA